MALDDLASDQPIAVVLAASLEAFDALVRTEGCSADVAPDKAKSSTTYGTELCWAVSSLQGAIEHFHLLWDLRKSGSLRSFLCTHWSVREMRKPRDLTNPRRLWSVPSGERCSPGAWRMALHLMAAGPRTERRRAARYEDEPNPLVVVRLGRCERVAPLHHGKRTV
jgi:hypothetical protein